AGRQDADLDRIEHAPVVGDLVEAVPLVAGTQDPGVLFSTKNFRRNILEWHLANALHVPWREEPVLLLLELAPYAADCLAKIDRLLDHFLRERAAAAAVHHRR